MSKEIYTCDACHYILAMLICPVEEQYKGLPI